VVHVDEVTDLDAVIRGEIKSAVVVITIIQLFDSWAVVVPGIDPIVGAGDARGGAGGGLGVGSMVVGLICPAGT
jgi:hypothetical protein